MNTFIIDVDDTISVSYKKSDGAYDYVNSVPVFEVIEKINQLYEHNKIILFTARGMKTFNGDINKIKQQHQSNLENWLKHNNVKYHELIFGKPWGENPIYVDDRCLSIRNFVNHNTYEQIIKDEKCYNSSSRTC